MNLQKHTTKEKLEEYSFLWSEIRLVIAAIALFIGGVPPLFFLLGSSYGLMSSLLGLSWIISGVASVYLLYIWSKTRTLFGANEKRDLYAFLVMIVSGINLGLAGFIRTNIGMSISSNKFLFWIVGIIYLASAYYLHKRWKANGKKLFSGSNEK